MKNPFPWRIALTAYLASLALVGFWPAPVDKPILGTLTIVLKYLHGLGAPRWIDYHFVESFANVVMFIPLGFLAAMALSKKSWWHLAAIGLAASLCMEFGQLLFISARYASVADVVTNTCGAVIGIVSARLLARIGAPRLAEA
ncbi:VanZ family protein [Arthrobacter sp. Rue61a]|uniref:VanZ family protein n=1 Tax=Arthrobacter sp. Rue61a TaxID=1118963 RepID=UPI00139232AD|nr:VanZ family protein [Arthrobacter sp. Rue61a]